MPSKPASDDSVSTCLTSEEMYYLFAQTRAAEAKRSKEPAETSAPNPSPQRTHKPAKGAKKPSAVLAVKERWREISGAIDVAVKKQDFETAKRLIQEAERIPGLTQDVRTKITDRYTHISNLAMRLSRRRGELTNGPSERELQQKKLADESFKGAVRALAHTASSNAPSADKKARAVRAMNTVQEKIARSVQPADARPSLAVRPQMEPSRPEPSADTLAPTGHPQMARRTNADKRRDALALLNDPTTGPLSNRDVARRCGVDEAFIRKLRKALPADHPQQATKRKVRRGSTIYEQDTSRIGKQGGCQ